MKQQDCLARVQCVAVAVAVAAVVGLVFSGSDLPCMAADGDADSVSGMIGLRVAALDSLPQLADASAEALECLNGLWWESAKFSVVCDEPQEFGCQALLRFPSAVDSGHPQNDNVVVEWYAVTDEAGRILQGPAMVVVHESGRGMTVGRMVARGLRDRGVHAFMVQLPFYGQRRPADVRSEDQQFATLMRQGIADVRRTLDAVKSLPGVDASRISLQGTSLGGFIAATTAGLDDAFYRTFVLLAGGNLPDLVATGNRETADLRQLLKSQGFDGEKARRLLQRFEPNLLSHRIDPERLWLYSATFDTVVTPSSSESFAKASGLDPSHHIRMPANHYSGVLFLPMVLDQIATECGGRAMTLKMHK